MLTRDRLRELLMELADVDDVQVSEDGGRLVAVVLARRFAGVDEGERQKEVWLLLHRKLNTEELRRVEFVMTDTPAEREKALAG